LLINSMFIFSNALTEKQCCWDQCTNRWVYFNTGPVCSLLFPMKKCLGFMTCRTFCINQSLTLYTVDQCVPSQRCRYFFLVYFKDFTQILPWHHDYNSVSLPCNLAVINSDYVKF
jgi:hypothetical protein